MKATHVITYILVIVGAINWGLVGLGMWFGGSAWNVVHDILGSWSSIEALVYVLVGIAGVMSLFCHKKNCKACENKSMGSSAPTM